MTTSRRRTRPHASPTAPRASRRRQRAAPSRYRGGLVWIVAAAGIVGLVALSLARLWGAADGALSVPGTALPIRFGHALDPATGLVTTLESRFTPGERFAGSVSSPDPTDSTSVYVEVVRLDPDGETVVQPRTRAEIGRDDFTFAWEESVSGLVGEIGYGRFVMRMYLDPDGPVFAQGAFQLLLPDVPD